MLSQIKIKDVDQKLILDIKLKQKKWSESSVQKRDYQNAQ